MGLFKKIMGLFKKKNKVSSYEFNEMTEWLSYMSVEDDYEEEFKKSGMPREEWEEKIEKKKKWIEKYKKELESISNFLRDNPGCIC